MTEWGWVFVGFIPSLNINTESLLYAMNVICSRALLTNLVML